MVKPERNNMSLVDKYRPRRLSDVWGQDETIALLSSFVSSPYPVAFLFDGETGTGKTSTALALANEIGIATDQAEFGGLFQIASGEQTGDAARKIMRQLYTKPFMGSGWNVLIVNECDFMTANAAQVWLDVLEHIPPHTVIIFTTNDAGKLPRRFRTRCECLHFESSALFLRPVAQKFINHIWTSESATGKPPSIDSLPDVIDSANNISFRQIVQSLSGVIRSGVKPKHKPQSKKKAATSADPEDLDILKSLAVRWQSGEKLADLAKPVGLSWQQLIGAFWAHNIVKRGAKVRA